VAAYCYEPEHPNYVLATVRLFGSLSSIGFDDFVPRNMAATCVDYRPDLGVNL